MSAAPVHNLLSRLEGVVKRGDRWEARCPCHDDQQQSLCIGQGDDGRALVKCQAGCDTKDVIAKLGLSMRDLFSSNGNHAGNGKHLDAAPITYNYVDESGTLLFQSVRFPGKDFKQRKPKHGGGWEWSVKGVRQVPYRLNEIASADPSKIVFVPEGEKDCNRLAGLGLLATCNAMGAEKWRRCHAEPLKGRRVVVLPDNDPPGQRHGQQVAKSLLGVATSIKVVELPGLSKKGSDISDWLDAGHTIDELLALVESTPEWEPSDEPQTVISQLDGGDERFPLTDSGNAERMVHLFGDRLRYCHPWKSFLVWDGKRWAPDQTGAAEQLAKATARAILKEASSAPDAATRDKLIVWARKSESANGRAAMLRLVQSEPGIPVMPDQLDQNHFLLNVENGTLDLRTGKLRPHDKGDMITKLAPVVYDPEAESLILDRFIDDIFGGDADLIQFVQRFLGYCLTGDVSEQILAIWYGVGANGKSTLINAILDVLGLDYAFKAPSDMLLSKRGSEHPTFLTDLHGKRLAACIETDEGRRLAESLTKELTGGDPIRARRMRENYWQFWPTHKVLLACNHKPTVRGTDNAMWRRIKLVPFNTVIPPEKRDRQLPEKLKKERPGILAWLVRGCIDWQNNGLGEPMAVTVATSDYANEEDTLAQFISECCEMGEFARCKASDLVDVYREWSGDRRMNARRLTRMLTDRGVDRYTNNGVWYRGIGVLSNGTTEERNEF